MTAALWRVGAWAAALFVGALAGYVFVEVIARGMGL